MTNFKLLTHDFRSPVQGGEPIWDGTTLPFDLPRVVLDTSDEECSYGWNYVTDLAEGIRIAGLWRSGRPNAIVVVTPGDDAVSRGAKCRASTLRIERYASDDEVLAGLRAFSASFGAHAERMAGEQLAWRQALARPLRDQDAVTAGLRAALHARGLDDWTLRSFETARAAWAAWDAWVDRNAWAAIRDAWVARDARDARDAWVARDARDALSAWAAWDARAARDAWDAWDAWDARAALTVCYASLQGWVRRDASVLTTGIRAAYANGLEIAVPTGAKELGFAMAEGTSA